LTTTTRIQQVQDYHLNFYDHLNLYEGRIKFRETRATKAMNFVQNILWNSVEGFVEAGTRSVGQYAGDALIKAGDVIENTGRGVGDSKSSPFLSPSVLFFNIWD
jgi:hypothetical protein